MSAIIVIVVGLSLGLGAALVWAGLACTSAGNADRDFDRFMRQWRKRAEEKPPRADLPREVERDAPKS